MGAVKRDQESMDPNKFKIPEEFVTSADKFDVCHYCKFVKEKTFVNPKWGFRKNHGMEVCRACAESKHKGDAHLSAGKEEYSTSTFKCPAKKCSEKELSFRDFVVGKCCIDGCRKAAELYFDGRIDNAVEFARMTFLKQAYDEYDIVQKSLRSNKLNEIAAANQLITARKNLHDAKGKFEASRDKVNDYEALCEKLIDNLSFMNGEAKAPLLPKGKTMQAMQVTCMVCSKNYDGLGHALHCGHRACSPDCLTTLSKKQCPECKKEF